MKYSSLLFIILCACQQQVSLKNSHTQVADLPYEVSNNAVAIVTDANHYKLYSFNGLTRNKSSADIIAQGLVYQDGSWKNLSMPPDKQAVLASVAVTIDKNIYLIGGYTVASDGAEVSSKKIYKLNSLNDHWTHETDMPTPVDDTVALVYKNRYIYLISGWFDVDNVDLVQVYDTLTQQWAKASTFPLPPVFGHAGAIINNIIVICDGVKVVHINDKKQFLPSPQCVLGTINASNHLKIDWKPIVHYSGKAHYRMAANSDSFNHMIFVAGSDNPYNFNGIGYNGIPSTASSDVRVFDIHSEKWTIHENLITKSMDHRGLLKFNNEYYILGGMNNKQQVQPTVRAFSLENNRP